MNCNFIQWFKKQASIRRHSDKKEAKASCPQNNPEEKKKTGFPRLSFRRRNRKKTESVSELEGSAAIIGISKKFSNSMPQEMESETKESFKSKMATSNSACLENTVSLTNSPTKTDGYRSPSELSYHSSFDYAKDTNESLSLGEKDTTTVEVNETKDEKGTSDVSKISNYDNQQTFHSVNSSIINSVMKERTNSAASQVTTTNNNVELCINAPLVKMEEICDMLSDKEYPEETKNITNDLKQKIHDPCDELEVSPNVSENNNDTVYKDTDSHTDSLNTKLAVEDSSSNSTNNNNNNNNNNNMDQCVTDPIEVCGNHSESENINVVSKEYNSFEEIDKLLRNTISSLEDEDNAEVCDNEETIDDKETTVTSSNEKESDDKETTATSSNEKESDDKETTATSSNEKESDDKETTATSSNEKESNDTKGNKQNCDSVTKASTDDLTSQLTTLELGEVSGSETDTKANEKFADISPMNSCSEEVEVVSLGVNVQVNNSEIKIERLDEKASLPDIVIQNNEDEENMEHFTESQPVHAEDSSRIDLKQEPSITNGHVSLQDLREIHSPVTIQIIQPSPSPSPVKRTTTNTTLVTVRSKTSPNYYPKELNPFGDDYSDINDEYDKKIVNNGNDRNFEYNKVTVRRENGAHRMKENGSNPFEDDTDINEEYTSTSKFFNERYVGAKNVKISNRYTKESSLNPFGDSDEEEADASPLSTSNDLLEEREPEEPQPQMRRASETPPRLPPKSEELRKKNRLGFIAPVPHPRKSKQTHHGSYTSLQNVSCTFPVPAPRSITPTPSTRTLNESTNPFGDDDDHHHHDNRMAFERSDLRRCSQGVGSSSLSVQEPFARSGVRASLPQPFRRGVGRKKRQAPLPPGFPQNKPPPGPYDPKMFTSLPRKRSSTSPASDFDGGFDKKIPTARANSPLRIPPPRPPPPKV